MMLLPQMWAKFAFRRTDLLSSNTMKFRHTNDVEDWLEPMDYETFWKEIRPYCLVMLPREKCDADMASGDVDEETVLYVMKNFARIELAAILKLEWRNDVPMMAMH